MRAKKAYLDADGILGMRMEANPGKKYEQKQFFHENISIERKFDYLTSNPSANVGRIRKYVQV
jgi:hypothetical protein